MRAARQSVLWAESWHAATRTNGAAAAGKRLGLVEVEDRLNGRSGAPRGFFGMQQAFAGSASCFDKNQSVVHSQTLPIMSWMP
jgi:hypothetical protein